MKNGLLLAAALLASALLIVAQPPAGAPGGGKGGPPKGGGKGKAPAYQPPEGPAPKLASGKPSMNGVWQRPFTQNMEQAYSQANGGATLPYTEWGKQQWESYDAEKGDYTGVCLPFGHNRSINGPDPVQIIHTDDQLAFLYEQNTWFKVLPTDGRAHNARKVPTWYGDSIAHWEGDTLVIVTKNFNGYTKLDTSGHPHSDQMTYTERLTRTDLGHIDYEFLVDDPKTYTKPWGGKRTFTLRTDWQIQEYSCEENNKGVYEGRVKPPDYAK